MNRALFSSASDEWETPQDFFDELNKEFHFTLDVCATEKTASALSTSRKNKMGFCKSGAGLFGAILRMEEKSVNGWKRLQNRLALSLCFFRHGQIQNGFTIGYMVLLKSDS